MPIGHTQLGADSIVGRVDGDPNVVLYFLLRNGTEGHAIDRTDLDHERLTRTENLQGHDGFAGRLQLLGQIVRGRERLISKREQNIVRLQARLRACAASPQRGDEQSLSGGNAELRRKASLTGRSVTPSVSSAGS